MTFWLYQPNQLFKSSSILPHKSKDAGDLLNFLTIFLLSFSAYMKNKINNEVWKKMLIGGLLAIVVIALTVNAVVNPNSNSIETAILVIIVAVAAYFLYQKYV